VTYRSRVMETPVMRTVARMEHPSTKARTTAQRFSVVSLFILTFMHERSSNVKLRRNEKGGNFLPPLTDDRGSFYCLGEVGLSSSFFGGIGCVILLGAGDTSPHAGTDLAAPGFWSGPGDVNVNG